MNPGELPRPQSTQSLPATMASAFSPLLSLGSPPHSLKPPMNRNQRSAAFGKGAKSATSGNKAKVILHLVPFLHNVLPIRQFLRVEQGIEIL